MSDSNDPLNELMPVEEPVPTQTLEFTSSEGFTPVDMRLLNAGDFAVILGCLIRRLGVDSVTIPDLERANLDAEPGLCTVLVCESDPCTQEVRFTLHKTNASEFRS